METILLIDGKNTAYRALFAARANPDFLKGGVHPFVVWMRFANVWIQKFKPKSVHVFWDCPKDDIWRKRLFMEYKNNRDTMAHYADDVKAEMHRIESAAQALLPYMGARQYIRLAQESDDLIYSACKILTPSHQDARKVIVVSSDADFVQLQWSMPHVVAYEPRRAAFVDQPDVSPVVQKSLCGDKSDNIDGYRGIGPVKSRQLAEDPKKLVEFLDAMGDTKFRRNLALVDLSMNPSRMSNELYILRMMAKDVCFDKAKINEISMQHKVVGLMSEYAKFAILLKELR